MSADTASPSQVLLLSQARPGMVLARPALDQAGTVLAAAGTELSGDMIHRLALRGIKRIEVVGRPATERLAAVDPVKRREMLDLRFSRVRGDSLMEDLHRVIAVEQERRP